MASIRKRNGKFQARIHRRGVGCISKTFLTRPDAVTWARQAEIHVERLSTSPRVPVLRDLLQRYARELTPRKKSRRSERLVLTAWARSPLSLQPADSIPASSLAMWRDERLSEGKAGSTVRNHLNTLSAVYRHAASEWGYQHLDNPVARLKRPSPGKARTRRTSDAEIVALKAATHSPSLASLIDLAVETGMRLSELVHLQWQHIDLSARTAHLPDTKNGFPRTVPLSTKATQILCTLRASVIQRIDGRVFPMTPHAVTVAFRRACQRLRKNSGNRLGLDLRFHDLRHEAVSRLFERGLNPMEVAAISGHRSMQMLARYTHITASSLIDRIG
jgi:integrase